METAPTMLDRDGQPMEMVQTWATEDLSTDPEKFAWLVKKQFPLVNGIPDPRSEMVPHQLVMRKSVIEDRFKYTVACEARQVGKDFAGMEIATEWCYTHPGAGIMVAAPSQRQSETSLNQAKDIWVPAFGLAIESFDETKEGIHPESLVKSLEIKIASPFGKKGGPLSSIIAVPGRPDTVRGESRCVIITEGDFFEKPKETWKAVLPSITNPKRGGDKWALIYSTPNGKNGLLWDIAGEVWDSFPHGVKHFQKKAATWNMIKVPMLPIIAEALGIAWEELRDGLGDDEAWAQEYMCQFLDSALILFSYELLAQLETDSATLVVEPEYYQNKSLAGRRVCGLDFGRKKDLTVLTVAEEIGNFLLVREVVELQNMGTSQQVETLKHRIAACDACEVDYTGPGVGIGDLLVDLFGEYTPEKPWGKIGLNTFSASWKAEHFGQLKKRAEDRQLGIPRSRVYREDLHSVYRTTTPSGLITYAAPHLPHGHADRCTSLVLANKAAARPRGFIQKVQAFTAANLKSLAQAAGMSRRDRSQTRRI